jgi:hypothetical protein
MNLTTAFSEARLQFDAQRQEQVELARQALELKIAQRDFIKAASEIKVALARLEATKATPAPPKPATAAPAPKAAVPARKAAPKAKPAAPKASPKRPASPQSIAIDGLDKRLAAVSAKIAALAARTK